MSFSILIPVFNTHISDLVEKLYLQATVINQPFEILLLDDCSELSISYINLKIKYLNNVTYTVLPENIGRAKIRNSLFQEAKFENCIVLDCDVDIPTNNFIKNYLDALTNNNVVVGGHQYSTLPPIQTAKYLHWLYGSKIEVVSLENRIKEPYKSFKTVCFAIQKSTFNLIKFDENIEGYGHEDTLFGIALKNKNIQIAHIENPVIHLGLDDNSTFLKKQKQAVINLKLLYENLTLKSDLENTSRLISWSKLPLPKFLLKIIEPIIFKNINSSNPNLILLQIQKLIWWKSF